MPKFARRWIAPLAAVSLVATMGMFSTAQGAAPKPTTTTSAQTTTTTQPPAPVLASGALHHWSRWNYSSVLSPGNNYSAGAICPAAPEGSWSRVISGGYNIDNPDEAVNFHVWRNEPSQNNEWNVSATYTGSSTITVTEYVVCAFEVT
jgi:hypothetical protein